MSSVVCWVVGIILGLLFFGGHIVLITLALLVDDTYPTTMFG